MNLVVKVCVAEVQGSVLDAEYAYPDGRSELQASVKWCNSIIIFIFMFYSAAHAQHMHVCRGPDTECEDEIYAHSHFAWTAAGRVQTLV